jgi:hypothetical protein
MRIRLDCEAAAAALADYLARCDFAVTRQGDRVVEIGASTDAQVGDYLRVWRALYPQFEGRLLIESDS